MRFLLDTVTCIAAMKRHPLVVQRLQAVRPDDLAISAVTLYELETGVAKCRQPDRERRQVDTFVAVMHLVDFDAASARGAARIRADLERRGCSIGPYDMLIAATAQRHRLTVVSGNGSEFTRVPDLMWEDWAVPIGITTLRLTDPVTAVASSWWSMAQRAWTNGSLTVGSPAHRVMEHLIRDAAQGIRLRNDEAGVVMTWARSLATTVPLAIIPASESTRG